MRKASSNTETYVGLFSFCRRFKLKYYTIRYLAVKNRLRIFRFNNLSYIEVNSMLCLLRGNKNFLSGNVEQAIDYLETLV
jgi:hypothetical protein